MWWITKRPDAQVIRDQADRRGDDRRLRVLSYRVILDVPLPLMVFVSGLLAAHRRELGTRDGTRALTCWKQAVFTLAWYSGKAHEPAGNVQALAAPRGVPLWVSDVLPGSTHDLTAARELVLPEARPYLKDLPILADSGYEGAGAGVHVPVRKPARSELGIDTKTRNALLRSLRYQGERGFALMSQRWRAIQHVSLSPTAIGDIVKSALVLTLFEHKMIS
jgi:hypothetical protein